MSKNGRKCKGKRKGKKRRESSNVEEEQEEEEEEGGNWEKGKLFERWTLRIKTPQTLEIKEKNNLKGKNKQTKKYKLKIKLKKEKETILCDFLSESVFHFSICNFNFLINIQSEI